MLLLRTIVILTASLAIVPEGFARLITRADLANKTICWNDGEKETFHADGKYEDSRTGSGTWLISAAGVEFKTQSWNGSWRYDIDGAGTITAKDGVNSFTGHYCK